MPNPISQRSLTLPNGLNVVLISAPRLKRCAAALRVAAGSHDVSARWPGLAHFLEHLFFLGTERFTADEKLMAFVQRCGGQVNASTRERTTDFFFELPRAVFPDGLERLCEMLAHPRMTISDQLREREVLHAEFIAWSRDDASRDLLKRLQPLSALHPLRGFHAGNRFSLPVPRQAFQHALQDFYRRFYQAGQMTLSLAGPQSLDELEKLAAQFGAYFAQGSRVDQQRPPALLTDAPKPIAEPDQRRVHLTFACEGLPAGQEQATAFLCIWMNDARAGGLVAELRGRGRTESLQAEVMYEFAGQAVIDIEVALAAKTPDASSHVSAMVFSWIAFFKSHYRQLLEEYARLEQGRLAVSGALSLARYFSAEPDEAGLSIDAVDALLNQLTPLTLLQAEAQSLPYDTSSVDWRLPEPNPFVKQAAPAAAPTSHLPALIFSDALPANGEAALYLRWTLATAQPKLARLLEQSLKPLAAQANQAGVTVAFSSYGRFWQLKVSGLAEPLPAVLEQALRLLVRPDEQTLTRYGAPANEPALIPIRQLLKTLPDHYLNNSVTEQTDNLQRVWAGALWTGFATGFTRSARNVLSHAARLIPGLPELPAHATPPATGIRWEIEPSESAEVALLMFYPTPSDSLHDEATWRLFAQLMQAPFYQCLRVELQLGYAVFSGFRQIAGHGGLLFGVQSPSASAEQLVTHVETFIEGLPILINAADLPAQVKILQDQLETADMEHPQAAELLWHAHLAGHGSDYIARLQHSLAHLQLAALLDAAHRLAYPDSARLCLSNRPGPF
ncbi:pyrroloquinoline quinone biosynthesis protein PqqF [Pseudomonas petrae]|uniref:Coenzyme PQQ synthesis protein F n=1 Tax=Pseudomonas petrae TaxID=2912190 RepID=A0ABS9I4R3_9PSED|nr:pyrroloquinoline quinone biosynthesis protein PqqF [Pseudomonas petrae]MCF7533372.1 pyrroloquinoline quinone biosynthesis protein PqqF [Pseudomonas petrae]MCF7537795.1 pyrroloquinoline quinone biosynthesis protein PqqF [Pseudomonas petrae]MCF7542372.1 pyrroloquinoline quinone biosynthesis protein PqqF [Pseudomonas petrae]MCF7555140.1 pyrroloquinoline quinone biosynthesis protein PqqF [Pseudomonas petrae]